MVYSQVFYWVCNFGAFTFTEVHSLSLAFARQLPQGGSREWFAPFIGVLAKIRGFGRFSSPLRNSEDFGFYHSSKYAPSVSLSLDSSLPEGAGRGCVPFNVPLGNRKVTGDFHRPYEGSEIFTFHHLVGVGITYLGGW